MHWLLGLRKGDCLFSALLQQQAVFRLRLPALHAGLRDSAAQRLLSELAALPNVHLAASVDHANAALLWDQQVPPRKCLVVCVTFS